MKIKISTIACLLSVAILTVNSCKKDDVVSFPTPDSLAGTQWTQPSGTGTNSLSFDQSTFTVYWLGNSSTAGGALMASGTYTYSKPNVTFQNSIGFGETATGVVDGNTMTIQGFLTVGSNFTLLK